MLAKTKRSLPDRITDNIILVIMVLILVITLYPFLNVLAVSFNESMDTIKGGIYLWPRKFTLANYKQVFEEPILFRAFINSTLRTLIGTATGVVATMMVSFVLSRKDFGGRRPLAALFAFTMYVSGGMIPGFLLIKNLGLLNTFSVYIVPGLIGVYYIYIARSFIDGIPWTLQEAAHIDGANDLQIFFKIVLPLCKPVIATIGLYYAVQHWNTWFDTYLFNSSSDHLTTLQYELMKVLNNSNTQASGNMIRAKANQGTTASVVTPQSIRMAITIVATVPILIVYPFVQKYFVSGMTLGAVKD